MTSRFLSRCAALLVAVLGASGVFASNTTTYTYDELGRLRNVAVTGSQTSVQTYDYDAAGNRTQSTSGIVPSAPPSITVPSSSNTGSYTISWGASTGTVTAYELYESTNASFSGQTKVYSGTATSSLLSGRANGTYYYRVRACSTSFACSGYRTGGNSITVTLPPGTPVSIGVPASSTTGGYTINWGTSTGIVTAYELYEATNASFTGAVLAYSGTATTKAISGKGNGSYYYRVRACNSVAGCSGYRTGANPTTVTLPPSPVPAMSTPLFQQKTTGNFNVSWAASDGTTAYYYLEEGVNDGGAFTSPAAYQINAPSLSKSFSGKSTGEYFYRVKACTSGGVACSGWSQVKRIQVCLSACN